MHIKMKIRKHFLDLIRSGIKTHEYRLANRTEKKVNVGDTLILVSNADSNDYVKVVVNRIELKKNWEDALSDYWEKDFEGLFITKKEVLRECYRFYPKTLIEQYGIEVYEIKLEKFDFQGARYLFDTNTIIERESNNNVIQDVTLTYKAIDELNGRKYFHPKTKEEINTYKDEKAKKAILLKLNAYNELISSNESNAEFQNVCEKFPKDKNSLVDNEILLQVYNKNVDILITSDRAILQKAKLLYIRERVFSPNDFLDALEKDSPKLIDYDVLSIALKRIGCIHIKDSFFDSLREDYGGMQFNDWLRKKCDEEAYVFEDNEGLKGFLYLKTEGENESYDHFNPIFTPAKRLKIGTFKITKSGLRLGERFLKIVFDNAKKRGVDEIYVTMFEKKRDEVTALKTLMEEWGFVKKSVNIKNGEIVLTKGMRQYDCSKTPKMNFPLIKENAKVSILPIASEYHTKLFPDLHLNNEKMKIYDEEACRYAIEKIYVCKYTPKKITPGDILCIYRMGDYYKRYTSVVTGFAILSQVINPSTEEDFLKECKNKTVFTPEELREFYNHGRYRTILKLLFLSGFSKKVNLANLYENKIIEENGPGPRLDTIIELGSFETLKELGGVK